MILLEPEEKYPGLLGSASMGNLTARNTLGRLSNVYQRDSPSVRKMSDAAARGTEE